MMIQGNYARAALAKLVRSSEKTGEYPPEEIAESIRQVLLWVDMLERKMELIEIDSRRPKLF